MRTTPRYHLFEVLASVPPKEGQNFRRNVSANVLTTSAGRAMEMFASKFPDAEIHKVERRNHLSAVLVDPAFDAIDSP